MAADFQTTLEELIAQMKLYLPSSTWSGRDDLLASAAAPIARARCAADEMVEDVKIGTADGVWLDLLARTYGLRRAPGEVDGDLRLRLQNVEEALTCAALLAAANAILLQYTATPAVCVEHFEQGPVLDDETVGPPITAVTDTSFLWGTIPGFTILVPDLGNTHPAWGPIYAEIERLRAAGVFWFFVIDDEPYAYYTYP